jgi:hypothetical protein
MFSPSGVPWEVPYQHSLANGRSPTLRLLHHHWPWWRIFHIWLTQTLATGEFEIGFSSKHLKDFTLTHISRYTSTVVASCAALVNFPCSLGVTCEKWTAA